MSKQSEWLDDYLAATRRVVPELIMPERHSSVQTLFKVAANAFDCPPELVITYSYLGATEIVASQDETYIIYDLFAGECFAGLNWLFSTQASVAEVQRLSLFIIGKKLAYARATRPMLKYLAHSMLEKQEFPWGAARTLASESTIWGSYGLSVQEAYCVYHEYAHHILQRRAFVRDVMVHAAKLHVEMSIAGKVLAARDLYLEKNLARRISAMYRIPITDEQCCSLDADIQDEYRQLQRAMTPARMRSSFREVQSESLIEEVAADSLAVFLTLLAVSGGEPSVDMRWKEFLISVVVGFKHIANLQLLNHEVSRLLRASWQLKTPAIPDLALSTALRSQAILYTMHGLVNAFGDDATWPSFETDILEADAYYWDVVGKHFKLGLPIIINDMVERLQ